VFDSDDNGGRLLAVARYDLNPRRNYAETALVIHEDFRRQGIASYLYGELKKYAQKLEIEGFYSEILPSNTAMIKFHKNMGNALIYNADYGYYYSEVPFGCQNDTCAVSKSTG